MGATPAPTRRHDPVAQLAVAEARVKTDRMEKTQSTTGNDAVRYEVTGRIATLTLNRPDRLNAMNDALMNGLTEGIQRVVADPEIRVLVLTGEGRGFCAGADLTSMGSTADSGAANGGDSGPRAATDGATAGELAAETMDDVYHPAIMALAHAPVPTIARVNGVVAGGGFGLALGCDITVAAHSARFVCTFGPRLGIVPDLGSTFHLANRLGSARARAVAMLGDPISAKEAQEWGLIWSAVDDDQLDAAVSQLADRLASSSPGAMTRIRQTLLDARTNTLAGQLDAERDHQRVLIDRNMIEGAKAFVSKREPDFENVRD